MVDELFKASKAAQYLGITRQRIYELALAGRIGQQMAGYWVFTQAELDAYRQAREHNVGGRPKREVQVQVVAAGQAEPTSPHNAITAPALGNYITAVLRYTTVQRLPSGGYVGASLDFPELNAQGSTRPECAEHLHSQLEQLIRAALHDQRVLPVIDGVAPPTRSDLEM